MKLFGFDPDVESSRFEALLLTPGYLLSEDMQNLIMDDVWADVMELVDRGDKTYDEAIDLFIDWRSDFLKVPSD